VNLARFDVMQDLVAQAAPDQLEAFEKGMSRLSNIMSERFTDGTGVAQAATSVAQTADMLTAKFLVRDFDLADTQRFVGAILGDIQRIANNGINSAEQATLTLDALTAAISPQTDARKMAIDALYDYLEHPSTYKPADFVVQFQKAAQQK
jgi:hypothetical protein